MKVHDKFIGAARNQQIRDKAEHGGVVTGLLKFALEQRMVDAVLSVGRHGSRYEGVPRLTERPEAVIETAGALHFATPSIARTLRKYVSTFRGKIAVVCKSCDARAIVELATVNQINTDNVIMIGVNCSGTLSPVRHIGMLRAAGIDPHRLVREDIDDSRLRLSFDDGTHKEYDLIALEREGLGRRGNCQRCEYPIPRMADLACGKWGLEDKDGGQTFVEVCSDKGKALLQAASSKGAVELKTPAKGQVEVREAKEKAKIDYAMKRQKEEMEHFGEDCTWASEFQACIKCYSCRDACPLCHCTRCVLERDVPPTVPGGIVPPPMTFGMIRVSHVACSCVNCGQCDDVCSADIPISALVQSLNRRATALFGYEAGMDSAALPPLSAIPEAERRLRAAEL